MTDPQPVSTRDIVGTAADPAEVPEAAAPASPAKPVRTVSAFAGAKYLLRRLLTYVVVAVVSVVLNFILPRFMPGDPATQLITEITNKTGAPPSAYQIAQIKARYGDPDRPVLLQFWDYLGQLAHLDLGRSARTALFTVGSVSEDAPLLLRDYLSPEERQGVAQLAVGDLCSRFIDAAGRPAVPSLDERTVALPLDDLRAKEIRICVAGGPAKVPALRAALQAGYVSHLVTDELTARAVLG